MTHGNPVDWTQLLQLNSNAESFQECQQAEQRNPGNYTSQSLWVVHYGKAPFGTVFLDGSVQINLGVARLASEDPLVVRPSTVTQRDEALALCVSRLMMAAFEQGRNCPHPDIKDADQTLPNPLSPPLAALRALSANDRWQITNDRFAHYLQALKALGVMLPHSTVAGMLRVHHEAAIRDITPIEHRLPK